MAGSRSSIDVFLSLHGQRKFAKELAASGAELEAMGIKGARSMARFAKSADSLKRFGKSWTHNVTLPVAALGVVSGYMAANFKRQMGLVATDAGGTMKEVEGLEGSVLSLAKETQYSPQELAESLFHVESAGYRGARALKVLRESAKLATSGNSELEGTTYALVSAQKALNEGESLGGITKTAAQLNEIVAHGDIRLEELTAAMSTGLIPTAKALGLGVQDVGSALDIMTARGIPAQRAAYALNFTLQKLVPSTEKAEKVFGRLGLSSEQLLNTAQHKGLPWALEVLNKHMAGLTKGQKVQTIDEMFGGGRMSKGLLVIIQHLGEAKEKFHDINGDLRLYKKHVHEAEEQPLVKLKTAWSSIQAALVNIGGDLLPAAVPALETLATDGEKIAHAFLALPGPVKAATLAFLVLTGPVASGLGYFASGVGRALILTAKLGRVAQNVGIFTQALRAGQGLRGSAEIGFNGFGQSAAVQTAKGFAYSLGPAVAAYGIGNIVTSATSGDWEDAGFEAGGAMAGGIAGFLLGGPLGAMFGVGAGSLAGELFGGLFKSTPKVSKIRAETEHLTDAMKGYRESLKGVKPAEKELADARQRHRGATAEEIEADRKLHHALSVYGEDSWQAHRAQLELWRAQRKVIRTGREEAAMHRLTDNRLQLYRENSLHAVASIKQLVPTQKRRIGVLNKENKEGKLGHKGLEELVKLEGRVRREKHQLTKVYAKAETLAGKPWAKRLEELTALQGKYGGKGKVLVDRLHEQTDAFKELKEKGAVVPGVYRKIAREIRATSRELANFHAQTEGLGVAQLPAEGPAGKHHPRPHLKPPRNGNHRRNRNTAQRLNLRQPGALASALSGSKGPAGRGGDINVTVPVNLDGREVARNTAKVAKDEALLQ